jgi:radical SAM superfamily enzyme YgiQ (UPF0313 family)
VDLPFIIEATLNTVTEEKIQYLKKMGCLSMSLGLESGSQYLRDNIIKKPKFTNEEVIRKVKLIKKSGISANLFNIIGFPEETKEMIFETINLNYKAKSPYCSAAFFQPWEGTALREYSIKHGLLDPNLKGLDNSLDNAMENSLKNLKVSKDELKDLYSKFAYYVYTNRLFWPLVKYVKKDGLMPRAVRFLLNLYLKIRFHFIS